MTSPLQWLTYPGQVVTDSTANINQASQNLYRSVKLASVAGLVGVSIIAATVIVAISLKK